MVCFNWKGCTPLSCLNNVQLPCNILHIGIRLNALQYGELKEKLHAPLREARGIIVQQTLGDMFIDAFKKQVEKNGVYNLPLSSPVSTYGRDDIMAFEVTCFQGNLCIYIM